MSLNRDIKKNTKLSILNMSFAYWNTLLWKDRHLNFFEQIIWFQVVHDEDSYVFMLILWMDLTKVH